MLVHELDGAYVNAWLESNPSTCRHCGQSGVMVYRNGSGGHYAKAVCPKCDGFVSWIPAPGKKKRRPAAHRKQLAVNADQCELCMRLKSELGSEEWFENHHIEEYAQGGSADESNFLVVCKSCHDLIHWIRKRTALQRSHRIERILADL